MTTVTRTVHIGSGEPCPRCLPLAEEGHLRREMAMPLDPNGAMNPLARDGSGKCCADCGAADTLASITSTTAVKPLDFVMARVATGSTRQEQFRLPGAQIGLVRSGLMRPCAEGDLDRHIDWLTEQGLWWDEEL